MAEKYLLLNGKKFFYDEISNYSFRNSIPLNGYETKTLEFCRNWLNGIQEFPMHTSGSTGVPKMINLTRSQMQASARRTIKLLKLKAGDRAFVCLNTDYIAGMMMLVRGFMGDLQMTIVEPLRNPLENMEPEQQYDFASFVPMQLLTILHETPEVLPVLNKMKGILVGGAPVSLPLHRNLQRILTPIYLTYGMTETASHIAVRRLNGPEATDYYEVLDNISLGIDKRGCLTVRGDITNGEVLITNDIVEFLTPTRFRWIGRADNIINTGGVKVQVEKVEVAVATALADQDPTPRFMVASQPDVVLGEKVVLLLESPDYTPEQEQSLLSSLQATLKKFELPKDIYYLPAFAETSTGKISRLLTLRQVGLQTQ
ncbi:AMP-binding protein [Pontibacter sp. CAU 1760]